MCSIPVSTPGRNQIEPVYGRSGKNLPYTTITQVYDIGIDKIIMKKA
jgi:hypothetical protein